MNTPQKLLCLLSILCLSSISSFAQQTANTGSLSQLVKWEDSLRKRLPIEKLYLQTDKPVYMVGDTLWFKAYLFTADYLKYSPLSGLLYVELTNDSATVVRRIMRPLAYGLSYGNLVLDDVAIPEGSYTLRAYTNWMRNFGDEAIFTKNIYITGTKSWLIKEKVSTEVNNGKESFKATVLFNDANNNPLLLREMQLKVGDGNHVVLQKKTQTDVSGSLNLDFGLPSNLNTGKLTLQVKEMRKEEGERAVNIPLVVNGAENTDIQFMPEGGVFLAGVPGKIGFKAVGEDGLGIEVAGKVVDNTNKEVISFTTFHKGMGSLKLTPVNGQSYTAKINLPDGQVKSYPLPSIKSSGTSLTVDVDSTQMTAHINVTPDLQPGNVFYLIAQSRGVVCYAKGFKGEAAGTVTVNILKNKFPTGIARFTLLNSKGQALNERLVYINHDDNLKIKLGTNKQIYAARDSVALQLQVADAEGKPVSGSFSLAVTDDAQVPMDSVARNGLLSSVLLTEDLKGTIEEPGYYMQNKKPNLQALDNLMLTQGWVGYDWKDVTGTAPTLKYDAEPEFDVKGKVVNLFNKPVAGSKVVLAMKNYTPVQVVSDADGRFIFPGVPITDTSEYFIQSSNKRGGENGVVISVDQVTSPAFNKQSTRYIPWFVNTNTDLQTAVKNSTHLLNEQQQATGDHLLKTVEINTKKTIKGSKNPNGPGQADQTMDEADIKKMGLPTLADILERRVYGLKIDGYPDNINMQRESYMISNKEVHFVIDGVDLDKFYSNPSVPLLYDRYNFLRSYLDSYPASQIIGIEVMSSPVYSDGYYMQNIQVKIGKQPALNVEQQRAYIEITTRSGAGASRQSTSSGTFVYTPISLGVAKQFYRPRYTVKNADKTLDIRTTIHWEPNVVTDKDGKATISFFTGDRPGNYTIIVEGADMQGNIGSAIQKIH